MQRTRQVAVVCTSPRKLRCNPPGPQKVQLTAPRAASTLSRPMQPSKSTFLLLLCWLLIVLAPSAFACPTDQVWIAGIYDEADQDDVVWLLTHNDSVVASCRGATAVASPARGRYRVVRTEARLSVSKSQTHLRSPPAS